MSYLLAGQLSEIERLRGQVVCGSQRVNDS
jgi:hypothetical protein